ncbi:MAG: DUF2490 domain-containing protein [Acidobacteriota bacterium]|nr:DUF2490 domain-containing protein [Blastocatellia bacterium]MDW8411483.1 DUF2490 domain-containing protein [Acidobacteriota bacterium]
MNKILPLFLLAILTTETNAQTTDFQLWNDTQLIISLRKNLSATIWIFGRFGEDAQTTTDARIGGLINKKINKYLTLSGGYLYRYANPTFRRPLYESRYLGIATLTLPLTTDNKWTLINRNMYQYEARYSRPNATVIRNRFWLKRKLDKLEPFVAFESFYDIRLRGFARYRTQAGCSYSFNPKLSADFYYVRQDETGNRPGTLNGVGTSLRVYF